MIGEQIKKYRTQKGFTQEELGKLVGVTTQAVSKWERGGVPDAETIPIIADALNISTDMLFGRENTKTIAEMIMDEIIVSDREKGFQKAFKYFWAASLGISRLKNIKETLGLDAIDKLYNPDGFYYYSRFCLDEGIIDAKLDNDCHYYFMMPEPADGIADYLGDPEELAEILGIFSDKDTMKIIFYMYSRLNTPVSLTLIASKTNIPINRAEKLLGKMCDHNLAKCSMVETENGFIKSYTFYNETVVIPLLCFARELWENKVVNFGIWFERNKPLL